MKKKKFKSMEFFPFTALRVQWDTNLHKDAFIGTLFTRHNSYLWPAPFEYADENQRNREYGCCWHNCDDDLLPANHVPRYFVGCFRFILNKAVPHGIHEHVEVDQSDAASETLDSCEATVVRAVEHRQPHVALSHAVGKGCAKDIGETVQLCVVCTKWTVC